MKMIKEMSHYRSSNGKEIDCEESTQAISVKHGENKKNTLTLTLLTNNIML